MHVNELIAKLKGCIWKDEDSSMELLLFRLLCLSAAVISFLVVIPANHLSDLPARMNVVVASFGVCSLFLARRACRGTYHVKTLYFLYLALLNLIWFDNGGSGGSISYYFLCVFLYVPIFFRGSLRLLLLAVTIADASLLHLSEFLVPHWVVAYPTPLTRTADLLLGQVVSAAACSIMLSVLLVRYDRERLRLIAVNRELRDSMEERRQVEKILLKDRELLHAVVEGTADPVFVKDLVGRYLLVNRAATRVSGREAAEILGKDDTELFPADQARLLIEQDKETLRLLQNRTTEETLTSFTGETRIFESSKAPLYDGEGKVVGLLGISRDVTDNRRMAEELRSLNEELERRVGERTARLVAAMREQESFSYSVSHDLRGPLRHINSYTAILEEEYGSLLPPEALQYMERIRGSSRRMGDLIDDLLELSRIGRSELVKVPVDLSEAAGRVAEKLKEAEPSRRVDLAVEPGLQVRGDAVLLEQMLENLISNAWKYSALRERGRIEFGRGTFDGREAFFVRDNGVGFDMAYKDKLFGPFQRLHGSEFEGSGIGLATVKRIVERHGGAVWAHGVVDRGATVYFALP